MARELQECYLIDACRTPFGRARPDGIFGMTRADDMVVHVIRALMERNPEVPKEKIDDNLWAATTQMGDQGLTIGRTTAILAGLPETVPGCALDRMCAGGMTSIALGGSCIQAGDADLIIAGGVEHMGHHPMGQGADPNPRFIAEKIVDTSALNMGMTAENLHDMYPNITKEECDEYALECQKKAKNALDAGKFEKIIVPMTAWSANGWRVAAQDEQPRPETTMEGLKSLRTPFRVKGRVTAGNSSGLNDGAAGAILASEKAVKEFGLKPRMRLLNYAFAGVKAEVMGLGPIPATKKALERAGIKMDDLDVMEINEAFAVQVVAFMQEFGIDKSDARINPWGGAIAFGHPLASSGPRLMAHLAYEFEENPKLKYGLASMCVGLGQGGSLIWENVKS
ncbi:MAG: acetyl-CoA acetyltransferase [Candidatus Solincola sediminis]|uniref:acetyl-CoA C-acyltransferase n=1 Tax=Candidatus Solincola sediminis TaxID=1797199 RepID=A0A1F2WJ62_9ACTN|nr:MAG: acetyl-CoA acetyltransferase [Candidatus Solincola sediminis]OFW57533.1 MAG: acetyl-CoA acetyltransferase [Candidatus Solincola sediminis]